MGTLTDLELASDRPDLAVLGSKLKQLGFDDAVIGEDSSYYVSWEFDVGVNKLDDRDIIVEITSLAGEPISGRLVLTGEQVVLNILILLTARWKRQSEYGWSLGFESDSEYTILKFFDSKADAEKACGVILSDLISLVSVLVTASTCKMFTAQVKLVEDTIRSRVEIAALNLWQKASTEKIKSKSPQ